MTFPQWLYLELLVAGNYPDQEPCYKAALWYHALFLVIPIVGVMLFIEVVRLAYDKTLEG